jgi:hypothetical protein
MIRASVFALALFAAACTPPATEDQPQQPTTETPAQEAQAMPQTAAEATAQDTCGARAYAQFVGQNIAAVTAPAGVRTIAPDTIVTQDFRPDRLNIIVDAQGVIQRLECY